MSGTFPKALYSKSRQNLLNNLLDWKMKKKSSFGIVLPKLVLCQVYFCIFLLRLANWLLWELFPRGNCKIEFVFLWMKRINTCFSRWIQTDAFLSGNQRIRSKHYRILFSMVNIHTESFQYYFLEISFQKGAKDANFRARPAFSNLNVARVAAFFLKLRHKSNCCLWRLLNNLVLW